MKDKKRVLLHICCCGCASLAISRLQQEGFAVTGFFYNPNIHPAGEYLRRKQDLTVLEKIFSLKIIEGSYDPGHWFSLCRAYARQPEGGRRCQLCFRERLSKTLDLCREGGYDFFTTTLTVSPHKQSQAIFDISRRIGRDFFLERNFKKQDGFKQAMDFSREHGLYRQDYCGCVYSLLARRNRTLEQLNNRK